MGELLRALTQLAIEATAYLIKAQGKAVTEEKGSAEAPTQPDLPMEDAAAPAPKRGRKPRATTAEPQAAAAAETSPVAAAETTEKESYEELCRLALAYIGIGTAGETERRAHATKHVADTYRAAALSAVPHGPQRLQLIGWFKDQLAVKSRAAAPSGLGV